MRKKITTMLFTVLIMMTAQLTYAQTNYVKQVIIVNQGHYDYTDSVQTVPVTVGAYDPATSIYTVFDTIKNAQFASFVLVDSSSIYVAADSQLVRYDANTYQRTGYAIIEGMRELAVWNNQLLITRGYTVTYNSYFQVYDKNSLQFIYDLPVSSGPKYSTEGIVVKGDTAYVGINNGFGYYYGSDTLIGLIGRVNLASWTYMNEIDLGTGGTNPYGVYSDNDNIYTQNNLDFSTASISSVGIASQAVNTVNIGTPGGCGASGYIPGFVIYQGAYSNAIGEFSTSTLSVQDSLNINRSIYGEATDTINNLIYVGETDYLTYGEIIIYNYTGTLVDSFAVSVSPGNIAMDIRPTTTGINELVQAHSLNCYPNPAHDKVSVVVNNNNINSGDTYILTDITGREIERMHSDLSLFSLDIHTFDAGIYILSSVSNPLEKLKIVKQ